MKKNLLLLLVLLFTLCFAGCFEVSELSTIEITSFQTEYVQGQGINYNFKVIADGEIINVDKSVIDSGIVTIRGFDSSSAADERLLSITYKGATTTIIYTVRGATIIENDDDFNKFAEAISKDNSIVYLKKNLTVTSTFSMGSNSKLIGSENVCLKQADTVTTAIMKSATKQNIYIENICFEGLGSTKKAHGIDAYTCSNVFVKNVTFKNCGKSSLTVNGSTVTVENCNFENAGWGHINVDFGNARTAESLTRLCSLTLIGNNTFIGDCNSIWLDHKVDMESNRIHIMVNGKAIERTDAERLFFLDGFTLTTSGDYLIWKQNK